MIPIMILQIEHFIRPPYFDSFARLHSDLLDNLEQATIRGRQAERFPRDTILEMYLSSILSSFSSSSSSLFFLLGESECKGCRNEEGTSVHNSKTSSPSASARIVPSSSRHGCRSPLFLEFSVALVTAGTRRKEILGEQVLRALVLVGYYFYSVSSLVAAWTMSPVRASFHLRVVLYHRDCIVRVYVIRIGSNLHGTFVRRYPPVQYNFPDKNELCTFPCTISTKLVTAISIERQTKTRGIVAPRVDFQFEDKV